MIIDGFRQQNPPSIPQIKVTKEVPGMTQHLTYIIGTPMLHTMGDLEIIAFYYFLRSREYTKPWKVKRDGKSVISTRTQ